MSVLGQYQNGNYMTTIYSDGTRVRENNEDKLIPAFAECMDIQISNKCANGCAWCYAGCTPDGKEADLKSYGSLFESMHPYTEAAVNINSDIPKDFLWFLHLMKRQNAIVNITISQNDFVKHEPLIRKLVIQKLIYGIGVSYTYCDDAFINLAAKYKNLVLHVINGVFGWNDAAALYEKGFKLLILGYKDNGRGEKYRIAESELIKKRQMWLYGELPDIFEKFSAVSFDNLALEQLNVRRFLNDEEWSEMYSGNEGEFTFYLDLVKGTYSVNSLLKPLGEIGSKTVDDMFSDVRTASGF